MRRGNDMDRFELVELMIENAREQFSMVDAAMYEWDVLESAVPQGLEGWPDDDLINAAQRLGIEVEEVN
jgi:hypothetical protein